MGKATRVKRENARERIAAQRAAQRKRDVRNRMLWTGGSILGVIVIVVAFMEAVASRHGHHPDLDVLVAEMKAALAART